MTRKQILSRRRRVIAFGSALAIMLGGGLAIDATGAAAQKLSAQQEESQNWSGYVVQSSAGKSFSSVSGSWVEPAVSSTTSGQGYAAFWVGLGGASRSSQSLEQVGTSAQVVDGQTTYSAWYELVPSAQVALPLTIHAGDHVTGKVTVNGTTVTVSLSDQSTGQSVTRTLQMTDPDTTSAEWIAEAPAAEFPDGSAQVLPLADFGNVTFTSASATAGGHTGSISDPSWSVTRVDMSSQSSTPSFNGGGFTRADVAQQSTAGAAAGDVTGNGTSFTVSYSQQSSADTAAYGYQGYRYPGYAYQGYAYQGYAYQGVPGWVYVYVQ